MTEWRFLLTEQEFAKNVMKTAEGAKANVAQQVQLIIIMCVIGIYSYSRVVFVTLLSSIYYRRVV